MKLEIVMAREAGFVYYGPLRGGLDHSRKFGHGVVLSRPKHLAGPGHTDSALVVGGKIGNLPRRRHRAELLRRRFGVSNL